jgi:protein SCO1/2
MTGNISGIKWMAWTAIISSLLLLAPRGRAQVIQDSVDELQRIDVVEHLGDHIDLNHHFVDPNGNDVHLARYFNQGRPVILVLGYYECPMLCNLVFNGLSTGLKTLDWTAGKEYQVLTVSIDPREDRKLAYAKQQNYVNSLGENVPDSGWVFMVGDSAESASLADELGFKYWYDEARDQYAHPAVVFLLTEDGTISRYLYGIEFKQQDLRLGLLEASEGKIGNTVDRIILYCFHYDPEAKGYVVFAGNVMRIGGVVTLVILAVFVFVMFRRERRRRKKKNLDLTRTSVHRA